MAEKAIRQKITQLSELLDNPYRNEGSVFRVYYELFQLSHEGRDLSLDTVDWLNETAGLFLSPQLLNVLTNLRLDAYVFKFAALNFIDIDDVIDDLLNGEMLKSVHSLPPGAFNKLKRQLLELPPPRPRSQQQPQSQPTVEKTPHQQPTRRNYFAAPSSTSSSASIRGNDSDECDEGVGEDPYCNDFVPQRGKLKGSGAFNKMKRNAPAAGPAIPRVNPPLFAPTGNRPQIYGYLPTHEPPFQLTQHPQFVASPTAPGYSSGTAPRRNGIPVLLPPGPLRRDAANVSSSSSSPHDYQIKLQYQTSPSSPSSLTAPVEQIDARRFLANIPQPQYSSVSSPTEGEDVLFDQHCNLYRFDDEEWNEHGLGQLKLLSDPSTKNVRLLMRRDRGLKVCAHHAITPDLKFTEVKATKNTWMWSVMDFADDKKGKLKKFAALFESENDSAEFRKVLEEAQSSHQPPVQQGVGNQLASKPVSWSCDSCYVKNKAEATKCVACDTLKPSFHGTGTADVFASNSKPANERETPAVIEHQSTPSTVTPALEGLRSFSLNAVTSTAANLTKSGRSAIISGDSEVNNVHLMKPVSPWSEVMYRQPAFLIDSKDNFSLANTSFMGQDSTVSGLSITSASSPDTTLTGFNKSASFSSSELEKPILSEEKSKKGEGESSSPRFVTIIPLPDIVDVKTGEEDEEIVFSYRAKLFRFDGSTKEWKEKGVGDIKILHHRENNTYRLVMRRDQVYKLACNHWITPEMVLKPVSDSKTAWTWFAMDFAQNELLPEHFAVRFKLKDTAHLFYSKFAECQLALKLSVPKSSAIAPSTTPSVTATKKVDDEEEEEDEEKNADQSTTSSLEKSDFLDELDLYSTLSPASGIY